MPRWLRVIRGMLGMGLVFSVGVGLVASVVSLPWLFSGDGTGREMIIMAVRSAVWAFPIGVAFSGVLALVGRRRTFDQLSLPRFAALGVGAGLLLFGALAINAHQAWSTADAIGNAVIFAFLGGGSATASLLVARKARPELSRGEDYERLPKSSGTP